MSLAALLKACRNAVRDSLALDEQICGIRPGPKPIPMAGERYLAIYGSSWRPGDPDLNRGLDEYYGVSFAWSFRSGYSPDDQHGEEIYVKSLEGIEAATRLLLPIIHQSIEVMSAANNMILDSDYKIIEPLRWQGGDSMPTVVDPSWFNAEGEGPAGLVMETHFGNARRKQPTSSIT